MTDRLTECPSKDALITYLYREDTPPERRVLDAHLTACRECRDEIAGLRAVQGDLSTWTVPELDAEVALLTRAAPIAPDRLWGVPRAFAFAAAASLVLGLSAGIANLDVRYDSQGLVVRTGWSRPAESRVVGGGSASAPGAVDDATRAGRSAVVAGSLVTPSAGSRSGVPVPGGPTGGTPWRSDLAALERQLREEFLSTAPGRPVPLMAADAGRIRTPDADLLRRIQAMIDESEVRQQRNLALRVAEVSRDFDLQRKADLVQIQQGLGRTEAEVARSRELMNYFVRTSQGQPR